MVSFDSLARYKKLVEGECFSQDQAKRLIELLKDSVTGGLATKPDIASARTATFDLRAEIFALKAEMAKQYTRLVLWTVGVGRFVVGERALGNLLGW